MVKGKDEVIKEFNDTVNMTLEELQDWMSNPRSEDAGLGPGQESGRKIIGILKHNPSKDPSKYRDEDIEHMRKVAAYNKRHLAQEGHMKETKSPEELEKAKSTISLRNWGHDPLKNMSGAKPTYKASGGSSGGAQKQKDDTEEVDEKEEEEEEVAEEEEAEPKEAPKKRGRPKKTDAEEEAPAEKKPRTSSAKPESNRKPTSKDKPVSKGKSASSASKPASKGKPASKDKPASMDKPASKGKSASKGKPASKGKA